MWKIYGFQLRSRLRELVHNCIFSKRNLAKLCRIFYLCVKLDQCIHHHSFAFVSTVLLYFIPHASSVIYCSPKEVLCMMTTERSIKIIFWWLRTSIHVYTWCYDISSTSPSPLLVCKGISCAFCISLTNYHHIKTKLLEKYLIETSHRSIIQHFEIMFIRVHEVH